MSKHVSNPASLIQPEFQSCPRWLPFPTWIQFADVEDAAGGLEMSQVDTVVSGRPVSVRSQRVGRLVDSWRCLLQVFFACFCLFVGWLFGLVWFGLFVWLVGLFVCYCNGLMIRSL